MITQTSTPRPPRQIRLPLSRLVAAAVALGVAVAGLSACGVIGTSNKGKAAVVIPSDSVAAATSTTLSVPPTTASPSTVTVSVTGYINRQSTRTVTVTGSAGPAKTVTVTAPGQGRTVTQTVTVNHTVTTTRKS
jgi:hypothetical protein